MDHLCGDNLLRGERFRPTMAVFITELHRAALRRWQRTLLTTTGCFFSAALANAGVALREGARELMMSMGSPLFCAQRWAPHSHYLNSDAAAEDVAEDSEAGFTASLTKKGALEAAGINIIIHRVAPAGHTVCADALAIM
jgi:hypothetical protein